MKKLRLFPKTFLYTFSLMLAVVAAAHILICLLAPRMQFSVVSGFTSGRGQPAAGNVTVEIAEKQIVMQAVRAALPVSLGCSLVVAVVCSLLFSRAITKPVQMISDSTGQMMKLDRSARCPVCAADEIGVLAQNINELYAGLLATIEHLEHEKDVVRRIEQSKTDFLRAASHELKTPVTALGATLENMILGVGKYRDYGRYLPECKEMTDQIAVMIHDILEASKLNGGCGPVIEPVMTDVSQLVIRLCEPYRLIAAARQIVFSAELPPGVSLLLPAEPFQRAVSNILANAVACTKPGKCVRVYMDGRRFVVENECAPVPDAEIPRLFQPFYRPDFSRSGEGGGNGLGLYIVDLLLHATGLSYSFTSMESPEGMRFTIDL